MWETVVAAVIATMPSMMIGDKMSNKSWRVINNNMIQTHAEEVFLWDNNEGVAIRVHVPSRPWKKLDPHFEAWMSAEGWDVGAFPNPPIDVLKSTKIAYEDGTTIVEEDNGFFFSTY